MGSEPGTLGIYRTNRQGAVEPQIQHLLKIPPDEVVDWSFVADMAVPGSLVEIIAFKKSRGRQVERQSSLRHYSIAALFFAVEDLERTFGKVKSAEIPIACTPMSVTIEGIGPARVFTCFGPSQVLCEIFQPDN